MNFKCRILHCKYNDYVKSENDTGVCHCTNEIELVIDDDYDVICTMFDPIQGVAKKSDYEFERGWVIYEEDLKTRLGIITHINYANQTVFYQRALDGMMGYKYFNEITDRVRKE